jgi:hypothetical protein
VMTGRRSSKALRDAVHVLAVHRAGAAGLRGDAGAWLHGPAHDRVPPAPLRPPPPAPRDHPRARAL